MTLKDAIFKRSSQREFREIPLANHELESFISGLKEIPLLHPQANLKFQVLTYAEAEKIFVNFKKSLIYAPYYLFFYGEDNKEVWHNVGYIGEISALWLTCNGFGSCFQRAELSLNEKNNLEQAMEEAAQLEFSAVSDSEKGKVAQQVAEAVNNSLSSNTDSVDKHTEDRIKLNATIKEQVNYQEQLPIVLAFGHPVKPVNEWQTVTKKSASKILISGSPDPSKQVLLLLEAACKAPSEYNKQPWRIWTAGNTIHIFIKPSLLFGGVKHQQADAAAAGAFVANFATLAELKQINYHIFVEEQAFADIKKLNYQLSISLD